MGKFYKIKYNEKWMEPVYMCGRFYFHLHDNEKMLSL